MRIGKLSNLFYSKFKKQTGYLYFHIRCLVEKLKKTRLTTKVPDKIEDFSGFDTIPEPPLLLLSAGLQEVKEHKARLLPIKKPIMITKRNQVKNSKDPKPAKQNENLKQKIIRNQI